MLLLNYFGCIFVQGKKCVLVCHVHDKMLDYVFNETLLCHQPAGVLNGFEQLLPLNLVEFDFFFSKNKILIEIRR